MAELLDVSTWSILQWVLVVLAAGFIGQFGKSFAQFVMGKLKPGRKLRALAERRENPPVEDAKKTEDTESNQAAGAGREKALPPAVVGEAPAPAVIAVPTVPQIQETLTPSTIVTEMVPPTGGEGTSPAVDVPSVSQAREAPSPSTTATEAIPLTGEERSPSAIAPAATPPAVEEEKSSDAVLAAAKAEKKLLKTWQKAQKKAAKAAKKESS